MSNSYRNSLTPEQRADFDRFVALRESGYSGPVGPDNQPATADNTPPEVWAALQIPFPAPGKSRNPR